MFNITILESGSFRADGGAMFGAIPKRAWARKYGECGDNLCEMAMRCLLVQGQGRNILVDLGMGNKYPDRVSYYEPFGLVDIATWLADRDLSADAITDVVLTHLHFDHCGYATVYNADLEAVPSFAKARYWVSKGQWDNSLSPSFLERDSVFGEDINPIYEAGQLVLVDSELSICEGFTLSLYDGHSIGQLLPKIETESGVVAFVSDLIPTASHVSLDWVSAYDLCAATSVKEKRRFLEEAVDKAYTLVYYHDAFVVSSKVERLNDSYIATCKQMK